MGSRSREERLTGFQIGFERRGAYCMEPTSIPSHIPADRADVQLGRKERHLAFGAGPHFCVGAPIARVQLPIALEEWLKQIPSFRLQKGSPPTAHTGDLMGLDS